MMIFIAIHLYGRSSLITSDNQDLKANKEMVQKSLSTTSRLTEVGITVLRKDDAKTQATEIHTHIQSEQANLNEPNEVSLAKFIVHFYRNPQDIRNPDVRDLSVELALKGYRILWVYSETNEPNFKKDMLLALETNREIAESSLAHNLSEFFRFITIEEAIGEEVARFIPLEFTVVAPHYPQVTVTYFRFPDDHQLRATMKIKNTDFLSDSIDAIALTAVKKTYCLPKYQESEAWEVLRTEAKRRFEPTNLQVNAQQT